MTSKQLKKKFLQELEKFGIISMAAGKSGLPRSTAYRLMEKDTKFRGEVEAAEAMGRRGLCDLAKTTIAQQVKDGNIRASMYILDRLSLEFNQLKVKELAGDASKPCAEDVIDFWVQKERERITYLKEKCLAANWVPVDINGKKIRDEELPRHEGYIEDMLVIVEREATRKKLEDMQMKWNHDHPSGNSPPPNNP